MSSTENSILIIMVMIGLLGLHYWDRDVAVKQAVQSVKDKYEIEYQDKALKAEEAANTLLNATLSDERKKHAELNDIINWQSTTIDGLRKRPTRSELNSAVAEARKACTGAELYREDGEFLTGEAARAERIRVERDHLYEQYERARQKLDALKGDAG